MVGITKTHSKFLTVLQKKESANNSINVAEILKATGWKETTFRTYLGKGQLSEYLSETAPDVFSVSNSVGLNTTEFSRRLSQSKHRRELGHNCKSGLAKALLRKSRDNMILALELYNRPSLENRLDSFVLCFSIAWEQLLKALLIEKDGETSIFTSRAKSGDIRETISLRECLNRYFKPESMVKMNISRIVYYRDQAVHLLMPEVQGIISRIFQSGVMNYGKLFHEFSDNTFLPPSHSGMISLVGNVRNPSNATLLAKYGNEVGEEIINLLESMKKESDKSDDIEFAIPLNVRLVFAKSDDEGNTIALSKAEAGMEGLANAIVVEKPVNRNKTHPFRTSDAVKEINKRLTEKYSDDVLLSYLITSPSKQGSNKISEYDFQSIAYKLKWKRGSNKYHYLHENPETHYYSDEALEFLIKKVMSNKKYLNNARESYRNRT